jgi:serine protease Do
VVLQSVEPGGPAARAGIAAGDVITAVNGKPVKSGPDLVNPIAETAIGGKVRIGYLRDREAREITAVVEDRNRIFPDRLTSNVLPRTPQPRPNVPLPAEVGLRVEELMVSRARRPDTYRDQQGVVVAEVAPTSFGEDIGFLRGDLITEINHTKVISVTDYRKVVGLLKPGQEVLFKVLRQDDSSRVLTVYLAGVVPTAER